MVLFYMAINLVLGGPCCRCRNIVGAVCLGQFSLETIGLMDFELIDVVHHAIFSLPISKNRTKISKIRNTCLFRLLLFCNWIIILRKDENIDNNAAAFGWIADGLHSSDK